VITFDTAKNLQHGAILLDGHGRRWRVSGRVKLWIRDTKRIRVPLKHGLYSYDSITESDFDEDGICHSLTLVEE
jgi:hypothetical protein